MSAAELAALQPGGLSDDVLEQALQAAMKLDGRELAHQFRNRRPELKVIYMSGWSGSNTAGGTDFLQKNTGRFLQKPCPSDELLHTIRRSLDAV